MKEAEDRSGFKSSAHLQMAEAWQIMNAIWGGALSLRKEGQSYLQKYPREKETVYDERKKWRSVFTDFTRRTIKGFAGMVFADNPAPTDAPKPIQDLFTDIDLCGNDFNTFLLNAYLQYLLLGNGFFLVTAPKLSEANKKKVETGEPLTAQDRANDRPYAMFFTADQYLSHRYENINGKQSLSQIVLQSCTMEEKGLFGEQKVIRHYIFKRGSFEIRKFASEADVAEDKFELEDSGTTSFSDILVTPIDEIGVEPPFLGMALLNILHYNKASDIDDHIYKVNKPQYDFHFDTKEDAEQYKHIVIANDQAFMSWGENGGVKVVEFAGTGIQISTDRLKDIESQMALFGMEKLDPTTEGTTKTATEVNSDNIQSQSELAMLTRKFENAVEQFIYNLGVQWNAIIPKSVNLSEVEKGKVKMNIAYDKLTVSADEMTFIAGEVQQGRISRKTYLELLPTLLRTLPEGWSAEEEEKRLQSERAQIEPIEQPSGQQANE